MILKEKKMIVNKRKFKIAFTDILLTALGVLYYFGIHYWFPVCMAMEDKPMNCHWAGEVLSALAVVLSVLSAVHILMPDEKIKSGMDVSMAGIAVLAVLIPGNIIPLCKSSEMMCRNGTSMWTAVFMISFIIIAAADIFIYLQSLSDKKHKRKGSGEGA